MMKFLFDKIGKKCKLIAAIVCIAGIALSVLFAIAMIIIAPRTALVAVLSALLMSLFSWLSSLSLYAIGEAADKSAQAEEILNGRR